MRVVLGYFSARGRKLDEIQRSERVYRVASSGEEIKQRGAELAQGVQEGRASAAAGRGDGEVHARIVSRERDERQCEGSCGETAREAAIDGE